MRTHQVRGPLLQYETAALLLCSIIERSLFDLYHHRRATSPRARAAKDAHGGPKEAKSGAKETKSGAKEAQGGEKEPTMLRELLEHRLITDALPPASAG